LELAGAFFSQKRHKIIAIELRYREGRRRLSIARRGMKFVLRKRGARIFSSNRKKSCCLGEEKDLLRSQLTKGNGILFDDGKGWRLGLREREKGVEQEEIVPPSRKFPPANPEECRHATLLSHGGK